MDTSLSVSPENNKKKPTYKDKKKHLKNVLSSFPSPVFLSSFLSLSLPNIKTRMKRKWKLGLVNVFFNLALLFPFFFLKNSDFVLLNFYFISIGSSVNFSIISNWKPIFSGTQDSNLWHQYPLNWNRQIERP